jgi:hypothetical protein
MTDWLNTLMEWLHAPAWLKAIIDHNRGLFLALIVLAATVIWAGGCQPTTVSPISGAQVNRDQLDAEASIAVRDITTQQAALDAKAADLKDRLGPAYIDLQRQEQLRTNILTEISSLINTYVPLPWSGVLATGLTTILLGLGYDNQRKDSVIAKQQAILTPRIVPPPATATPTPAVNS